MGFYVLNVDIYLDFDLGLFERFIPVCIAWPADRQENVWYAVYNGLIYSMGSLVLKNHLFITTKSENMLVTGIHVIIVHDPLTYNFPFDQANRVYVQAMVIIHPHMLIPMKSWFHS